MISNQQVETLIAGPGNVLGPNGDKIGAVGTFYLDDQTNEPAWVTVSTGLLGAAESFVPLSEATVEGMDVLVPYSRDEVQNSPQVQADGSITPEEEVTLYRYYGFTYDDDGGTAAADNIDITRANSLPGAGLGHYVVTDASPEAEKPPGADTSGGVISDR